MTTLAHYRGLLRTNKHRLDDELEQQAELQERIAQEVTRLQARVASRADELKRTESTLVEDAYKDATERGVKITVEQANSKMRRNGDRQRVYDRLLVEQAELRDWENLLDAWKVKGFTLRDLGALYSSDYFSLTQVSVSSKSASAADMRRMIRDASRREDHAPAPRRRVVNA